MLSFYLKEALLSFKGTKIFSFFSIIALALALLFLTTSIFLFFGSKYINEFLTNRIEANIFIEESLSDTGKNDIFDELKGSSFVSKIEFFTKEKAYKVFIQETGQDFKTLLDSNPLPEYYAVRFNKEIDEEQLNTFYERIKIFPGVEEVILDYNTAMTILNFIQSSKIVIGFLAVLLLFISIYLVYSSSKIYISYNVIKYNTMKLVGAKLSTIKIPLMIRGLLIGFTAALISCIIFGVLVISIKEFYPKLEFVTTFYFVSFVLLILGLILGPIGTGIFNKKLSLKIDSKL